MISLHSIYNNFAYVLEDDPIMLKYVMCMWCPEGLIKFYLRLKHVVLTESRT